MTVDEALAIVETVLDDDEQLNDVQELIFKQCWEGRQSYEEIAKLSKYDDEYIKAAGYKLWKLLSEAFEERVKKNNIKAVIKRYLRRHQVILHRTQVIGVNLSGANLTGARLLLTNLSEADFYQTDLNKSIVTEDNAKSDEKIIKAEDRNNQGILSNPEERIYHWNDLRFHSQEQVKIAEALDRTSVLFFPNSKARLTTPAGRQNQEPGFLIFHQGKWGILEIWHPDTEKDETRDQLLASQGISIIQYFEANRCSEEPDRIVQEFLDILSQG
jgi:Pentapeptide repeats (8 copies)